MRIYVDENEFFWYLSTFLDATVVKDLGLKGGWMRHTTDCCVLIVGDVDRDVIVNFLLEESTENNAKHAE